MSSKSLRGYTGWTISEATRQKLLETYKPMFPDFVGEHITCAFDVTEGNPLPPDTEAKVFGQVYSDRVQALRVEIGGDVERADGSYFHLTWSLDRSLGAKPKDSNKLLRSAVEHGMKVLPCALTENHPIPISIVPTFFPFETKRERQRWFDQTEFYDGSGKRGNCTQVCIAGLLDLPISEVPNFIERGEEMHLWVREWMEERGFEYIWETGQRSYEGLYLAAGPAGRGCSHMVVMRDGKLFHDPHPSKLGLDKQEWTIHLVPHDPSLMAKPK